ncbi:MAG: discoidin domain-containing protein [Candidatus Rifleibacteriota bacterium]
MGNETNVALKKNAVQSSFSRWSTPDESSAAIDGIKNGDFSFHTEKESCPWWQVDLGKTYPVSSIVVYNRGVENSELADRAKSMAAFISPDGMSWQKVHNGGTSFGGILDKKPLRIEIGKTPTRFVRLQLTEENYFHLDEVEIFADTLQSSFNQSNQDFCPSLKALGAKYGTDKVSHGFCDIYEKAFAHMRPKVTKILELGVFFGASLCMWRDWFPNAVIHGADHFTGYQGNGHIFADADRFLNEVKQGIHERIKVHELDQSKKEALENFAGDHLQGSFDLILDDASHLMLDQQQTLGALFRLVKPGGYFVIEDLQSSYSSDYDIDLESNNTTLSMIEHALAGNGWVSRYMSSEEIEFLNENVDLSQTKILGTRNSKTGIIRRKMLGSKPCFSRPKPGSLAIVNYATFDELNQGRQQKNIEWARQWFSQGKAPELKLDVVCFGPDSLDQDFIEKNRMLLSETRGGGYWLWKPAVINAALNAIDAEYILYCDCGSTIQKSLPEVMAALQGDAASVLAFDTTSNNWYEYQWTKGEVLRAMNADIQEITNTCQIGCTASLWKTSDFSRKLAAEWLSWMQNPAYVTDSPSADGQGDKPGFLEHRHDQSIFSILIKKRKLAQNQDSPAVITHDFRTWVGHHQITRLLK